MVIKLSEILKPEYVSLDIKEEVSSSAIEEVTSVWNGCTCVTDLDGLRDEIFAREEVESTCMGNGVAFPHARTNCVNELIIAAGRSSQGVKFENCGEIVNLIFVIGTPQNLVKEYLGVVGALARVMKDEETRQALLDAPDQKAFWQVFHDREG